MQRVLIVDGHSMIFAWQELALLHARKTEVARSRLVEILLRYADASGVHVVLVFDGRGPKANLDEGETRMQVFYSKAGQSADCLIERFVVKYATKYAITVATDDNLERTTVTTFGAQWMSSEELRSVIGIEEKELAERLRQLNNRK